MILRAKTATLLYSLTVATVSGVDFDSGNFLEPLTIKRLNFIYL